MKRAVIPSRLAPYKQDLKGNIYLGQQKLNCGHETEPFYNTQIIVV